MSKSSEQPEPDEVDEVLARNELPLRYHGEVDGVDVEVLASMAQEGPMMVIFALERTGPYDNLVPVSEFTQQFTVTPPEGIEDPNHARDWFWNIYHDLGWDVLDPERKSSYEIVEVNDAP